MPRQPLTPPLSRKGRGSGCRSPGRQAGEGPFLPREEGDPPATRSPVLPATKRHRKDRGRAGRSQRGLSFPPVPPVLPAGPLCPSRRLLAGIHRQRGAGGAEATRKRSEAVGSGARLAPSPLAGEGRGEGRKWPVARVAPPMRGNDRYGLYYWGKGRCGSPHAGMTPTDYRPQARSDPSVMPPGPCPSRRAPLSCRRPPLSFPPVVSGNPVSFSSVPFIRVTLHGNRRERHWIPANNRRE